VGVALGGGHRRRGDADDGRGDVAAPAVQGGRLVETGAAAGRDSISSSGPQRRLQGNHQF